MGESSIRSVEGLYLRLSSMTFRFSVSNGMRPRHLENVNYLLANQQNDTCGIIARFDLTQSDVPADDDAVVRPRGNLIVGREPLSMIVPPGGMGVCWYRAEKAIGPISRFSSISTWAGSCSGWRSSPYCRV
jgi:hypothetical protein